MAIERRPAVSERDRRSPSMLDAASELLRVVYEVSRLSWSWFPLLQVAKRGDGHPVMVVPGFIGGDESTLMLRRFLTGLGYVSLPWLQGQNTGKPELLEGAKRRCYRAHQAYGRKISLVGQSLGGVYAREIALELPNAVRCVITLGSPVAANGSDSMNRLVQRLFELLSGQTAGEMRERMQSIDRSTPLGIPATSVYSRNDGVVGWDACLEFDTELTESVEVTGSHTGMAMNPDVLHVIADRLAQDPADWQKFDRSEGCRRWIYPEPAPPPSAD